LNSFSSSIQRDAGGNTRGNGAIDLQMSRSANTQVAAGNYAVISGGKSNTATLDGSLVVGGGYDGLNTSGNTASGWVSTVVGGMGNVASGNYSFIGGGGEYGVQVNGNTASGNTSVVVGGVGNTASGDKSFVGGGGPDQSLSSFGNVAGGTESVVAGGTGNNANGNYSAIPGGRNMTLSNVGDFGFNGGTGQMWIDSNQIAAFGNTNLWLANNDNKARAIVFWSPSSTTFTYPGLGDSYVGFKAGIVTSSVIWTLPLADGTSGQVLQTDGSGTLGWQDNPKVVYGGNSGGNTVNNSFMSAFGSGNSNNENLEQIVVTRTGTLKNFFVNLTVAPGGVASKTLTIRKSGVGNTTLTVTIAGASTTGSDTNPLHAVSVSAGDLIDVQVTHAGGAAGSVAAFGFELY
jgi:hypothetical protein